jgi:hypothetical protein
MSDQLKTTGCLDRFDQRCAHMASKDEAHAAWMSDASRGDNDRAGHRRYHGLFEDLAN